MSISTVEVSSPDVETPETNSEPIKLSATRLRTYLTCPRQFRYRYIGEVPTVLTGALAFGKTIHQVIHDLHQWSIYSGEPLNASGAISNFARQWEQVITEQEPVLKDIAEIADYAHLAELMLIGYVEAHKDRPQPFLLEFPFEIKLHDEHYGHHYVLSGVIDRIDQEEDGLVIVDFKTGKRKPSMRDLASDVQLSVYAFAAGEVFGREVKELVLYHLRDQTPLSAKRSSEQIRQLKDFLMPHVVRGIAERRFAPRPGYWCNFCEFKNRCQAEGPDETM
jgi:DNA helicase-2/ATP-dependent DNA helicase PcrA